MGKFESTHSVYRAYRLLNGRTIFNKKLSIVVPMEHSFTKEEIEMSKHEASEKRALHRIIKIINKIEKKAHIKEDGSISGEEDLSSDIPANADSEVLRENDDRKMFIGGLPMNFFSKHKLWEYFSKYGEIEDIDIKTDRTGRTRGFCFIVFKDTRTVDQVIEEGNHFLGGKE